MEDIDELIVLLVIWAISQGDSKSVQSSVIIERQEKIEDEETVTGKNIQTSFFFIEFCCNLLFSSPANKCVIPISEAVLERNNNTGINTEFL